MNTHFSRILPLIAFIPTGCSNFIDGMAGLGQLNYDSNGNAYVPQYPDVTAREDIGGDDCFGYVEYGRMNNNTFARVVNTSDISFDYTLTWEHGEVSSGTVYPGTGTDDIWKIHPENLVMHTQIRC